MELALSGSLLRTFFKSVACLAKIGSEILIEATAGGEPGSGVRDGVRQPSYPHTIFLEGAQFSSFPVPLFEHPRPSRWSFPCADEPPPPPVPAAPLYDPPPPPRVARS